MTVHFTGFYRHSNLKWQGQANLWTNDFYLSENNAAMLILKLQFDYIISMFKFATKNSKSVGV